MVVGSCGGAGGPAGLAQFGNTNGGNPPALMVTGAVMVGAIETGRPPITLKNATPVARLFADTLVLVVPAGSPVQTLKDPTDKPKANPGTVSRRRGSRGPVDHSRCVQMPRVGAGEPDNVMHGPLSGGGGVQAHILVRPFQRGLAGLPHEPGE